MKFTEKSRFVLSKKVLLKQYKRLEECSDEIVYSHKTNPSVGKVLEELTACKFAINSFRSTEEISNPARITYFLQGDTKDQLLTALKRGVKTFVVDNENDLTALLTAARKQETKISLYLRTRAREHTIYTGKYFVYGLSPEALNNLLPRLHKHPSVSSLGIHFHRRTQNIGEWFLKEDFEEVISPKNQKLIHSVNIGGGIPVEYVNSSPDTAAILKKIKGFRSFLNNNGLRLITEPGRFLSGPSVRLETEVINTYGSTVVVDASIFNGAMDVYLLGYRYRLLNETVSGKSFLIKGSSPDSLDIFRYKVFLPASPSPGQKLTFLNAGAYNFHTTFNNMPRIRTVVVEGF